MKKTLAVTVAVVFVLAFAAPVFAQSMEHNATYKMDGTIDLEKQVGHLCNTGAEMKQTISGEGEMDKVMDTAQVAGRLTVDDDQDWVTAEDAVRNLTVTSVIELCAPAKHEYERTDWIFGEDTYEMVREDLSLFEFMYYAYQEEMTAEELYEYIEASEWELNGLDIESKMSFDEFEAWYDEVLEDWEAADHPENVAITKFIEEWHAFEAGSGGEIAGMLDPHKMVESGVEGAGWTQIGTSDGVLSPTDGYPLGWEDSPTFTEWAVEQAVAAGDGNLVSDILAAADYDEVYDLLVASGIEAPTEWSEWEVSALTDQIWAVQVEADPGFSGNLHQDFEAAYGPYGDVIEDPEAAVPGAVDVFDGDDYWYFQPDASGAWTVTAGDDYVGNYFNIDQMARTSQGAVRRYIDVSSPWSHAYLYEDMEVVGMAEIEEDFTMDNLAPGEEAVPEWWDLF